VKSREKAATKCANLDLENAGLILNNEKCQWEPQHNIEWLGFQIDLCVGGFLVTEGELDRLRSKLLAVKEAQLITARQLASLIRTIISMSLALGPVTCLMTHNLYAVLNDRTSWYQKLALSTEASDEVQFWLDKITHFNGRNIWPTPSVVRVVYSDASSTGYGGYMVEHGNNVAIGQWSPTEAMESSTWRGLRAVRMILESFQLNLRNDRVQLYVGSQTIKMW